MKRSKEKKCIHDTTKFIANPIAKADVATGFRMIPMCLPQLQYSVNHKPN